MQLSRPPHGRRRVPKPFLKVRTVATVAACVDAVIFAFVKHLHLLPPSLSAPHRFYPSSSHKSMWHLPCPPLLLPMPILFIMPPSSPTSAGLGLLPLTSLCHVRSLLSTVPQGPFITLMPTYTAAFDGLLTPPQKKT